jgi:hypothetical protein
MNPVALTQATLFELGHRPFEWIVAIVFATLGARKAGIGGKNLVNVLCIVGPVRRDVNRAAGLEQAFAQIKEARLHNTTFVVTFFWPGVREVEVDALQAGLRDLFLEDFDRVVGDESQI